MLVRFGISIANIRLQYEYRSDSPYGTGTVSLTRNVHNLLEWCSCTRSTVLVVLVERIRTVYTGNVRLAVHVLVELYLKFKQR